MAVLFSFSKRFSLMYCVLADAKDIAKDVVFLLDGSDGTRSGFHAMSAFVQRIVEKLNVDESKYRVSVVQYSDNPKVEFYLKTYSTKADVLNTIKVLKHKGGREANTGAALQFVRHQVFTSSSGSRRLQDIPQILILMSSRSSSDEVIGPAMALKDIDIKTISIGVENADLDELKTVSFQSQFAYVNGFDGFPLIQSQLVSAIKNNDKFGVILNTEAPESTGKNFQYKQSMCKLKKKKICLCSGIFYHRCSDGIHFNVIMFQCRYVSLSRLNLR